MAETKSTEKSTEKVIETGAHDRVQSLSITKEGTPDQSAGWEFLNGDDATVESTKEQFRQIAVSAIDAEKRAELGLAGTAETEPGPDKAIDALKAEHQKAEAAAEKKAEALVKSRSGD